MRSRKAQLAARLAVLALLGAAGARLDAQVDGPPGAAAGSPPAQGGEAAAAVPGSAEEAFTSTLSAEGNGGFIDKGRIAEETLGRLESLRAAGNPHIRKGLKIEAIVDEPEIQQVDQDKLRAEAIRQIEERTGFARPILAEESDEAGEAEAAHDHHHLNPEDRSPDAERPGETGGGFGFGVWAIVAAIGAIGLLSLGLSLRGS